ncbi:MAG: hypothetical protein GX625_09250 [Clostridiaceae bacterium]|nr:hypothetical protein [Clostridiaceae bacterium]
MYYNNKRLALSVFWIISGATLFILSITGVIASALYSGMGGALMAVGILQVIRNLKYRKNSTYKEKVDIEFTDERNKYLRMKAWSWAGYLVVLIEAIAGVVAAVQGQHLIQQILFYSICLIVFIYWISYLVLSKKY